MSNNTQIFLVFHLLSGLPYMGLFYTGFESIVTGYRISCLFSIARSDLRLVPLRRKDRADLNLCSLTTVNFLSGIEARVSISCDLSSVKDCPGFPTDHSWNTEELRTFSFVWCSRFFPLVFSGGDRTRNAECGMRITRRRTTTRRC